MYNLHPVTKPEIFDEAPLNNCSFAMSKLIIFSGSSPTHPPATAFFSSNRLAGATVEEQVQWVLSHVQGGSANI